MDCPWAPNVVLSKHLNPRDTNRADLAVASGSFHHRQTCPEGPLGAGPDTYM